MLCTAQFMPLSARRAIKTRLKSDPFVAKVQLIRRIIAHIQNDNAIAHMLQRHLHILVDQNLQVGRVAVLGAPSMRRAQQVGAQGRGGLFFALHKKRAVMSCPYCALKSAPYLRMTFSDGVSASI